ncbi:MAG: hypothetical protein AAB340_02865 [Patescibacteria group bacterium]|mgnify:CR=1 FL=1
MNKKQEKRGYSVREVDEIMKKYIKKSAERLARNLKFAWKKNSQYVGR